MSVAGSALHQMEKHARHRTAPPVASKISAVVWRARRERRKNEAIAILFGVIALPRLAETEDTFAGLRNPVGLHIRPTPRRDNLGERALAVEPTILGNIQ